MITNVCLGLETEAGLPGRHGDSAAPPVGPALRCASDRATTPPPATGAACAWAPPGTSGKSRQGRDYTVAFSQQPF